MSDFVQRTAAIIQMMPRRAKAVEQASVAHFGGNLSCPRSAPTLGYIETLTFLDNHKELRPGDTMVSALQRCGIVRVNQDGLDFRVLPHGLFAGGVVSDKGKELLDVLAKEGFEGDVKYLADGVDHTIVLTNDGVRSSEDLVAYKAG
ncbi:hypothetical protein [Rhizobium sp. MHM7A]|uniref:hypothetical protein n=1 Tax=Rhizobium sp. MHM7A TaxID=2583233 RepID=UPI0011062979|nr:hypothetical protein [Rhizobium sp. MHM7A]TLX16451.1 hypothetical protein FFR93_03700 [Rhizobium sp. MHM7A]